jgi:hypothetical protein
MAPPSEKPCSSISTLDQQTEQTQQIQEQPDLEKQATGTADKTPTPAEPHYPESDLRRGIVGWESQNDSKHPQNFSPSKKWSLLALISAFTLVSPLASSMFSPTVVYMADQFNETNETVLSFTVSIYLIGYIVSFPIFYGDYPF